MTEKEYCQRIEHLTRQLQYTSSRRADLSKELFEINPGLARKLGYIPRAERKKEHTIESLTRQINRLVKLRSELKAIKPLCRNGDNKKVYCKGICKTCYQRTARRRATEKRKRIAGLIPQDYTYDPRMHLPIITCKRA